MKKYNKSLYKALSISSTILGSLMFCILIGYIIYQKTNNKIWFLFLAFIGIIIGLYEAFKQMNK